MAEKPGNIFNADDDMNDDDDDDTNTVRQYPHTFELIRTMGRVRRTAESLFTEIAGIDMDYYAEYVPSLCGQVERLHQDVASLKDELDMLQEISVQKLVDHYRAVLRQLRVALIEAPTAQRDIFHLGDLSGYWDRYEAWYKGTRDKALNTPFPPTRAEVRRAQRLSHYHVRVIERRSPRYPNWDLHDDMPEEKSLKLRRRPQQAMADHMLMFKPESMADSCSWCGVLVGQLHLVDHTGRPMCDMEECPHCGKCAVSCGHCIEAQEEDAGHANHTAGAAARVGEIDSSDVPF